MVVTIRRYCLCHTKFLVASLIFMLKAAFRFVSEMNQLSNCFVDGSLFESPSSTIFFTVKIIIYLLERFTLI